MTLTTLMPQHLARQQAGKRSLSENLKTFFRLLPVFFKDPSKKNSKYSQHPPSTAPRLVEREESGRKESFQGMEGSVDFRDLASATCFEANANLSRFQGTCISVEERRRRLLCYAIETRKNVAQVHALGNWLTRQNGDAILAVRNKFLIRSSIFCNLIFDDHISI